MWAEGQMAGNSEQRLLCAWDMRGVGAAHGGWLQCGQMAEGWLPVVVGRV